ncbi:hypothetical protein NTE_02985 [Candidatus Nitrososphaera evergladensis SR1]|jgi:hypothetical protein|uniref:Uncharacterized protein n=1 Tax=Candidatus Nitrososphaera evergladensis SR1 TaxID=1459636 RepID=A0A075MUX6_9ARCH|nr:hypothetical protein [Candidatus Nitrososphaera evergladensis]AIF85020.1 hypothetical protein NTE_02985 [Candidatus Nitrososphaera evergladensis SR1]
MANMLDDPFAAIAEDVDIQKFIKITKKKESKVRTKLRRSLFEQKGIKARKYTLNSDSAWKRFSDSCFAPRRTDHNRGRTYTLNEWIEKQGWIVENEKGKHFTSLKDKEILFITAWDIEKDVRIIIDGFHRACAIKYLNHSPETLEEPFEVLECYGNNMEEVSREHRLFDR